MKEPSALEYIDDEVESIMSSAKKSDRKQDHPFFKDQVRKM
jgi:hypothetical protein